jgi:hypothetical protein
MPGKQFYFEKKNLKTFTLFGASRSPGRTTKSKVFASFFKKEVLPSFAEVPV